MTTQSLPSLVTLPRKAMRKDSVSDSVHNALRESGYPLLDVHCWCGDENLVLSGTVDSYFHAQMALETARRVADGQRVDFQIEIIPATSATPIFPGKCA